MTQSVIEDYVSRQGWALDTERAWVGNVRDFYEYSADQGWTTTVPVRVRQPRVTAREVPAPWADPLAAWRSQMVSDGFSEATIRTRVRVLKALAAAFPESPWELSPSTVTAHAAQTDWNDLTRGDWMRIVRLFFEFAVVQGWTEVVPTPARHASLLNTPVVDQWSRELETWRSYLAASGHADSSIKMCLYVVKRFACTVPELGPWDVELDDITDWLGSLTCGTNSRRSLRNRIASFYRWGSRTGRVSTDPCLELPGIRPKRAVPRPAPEAAVAQAIAMSDARVRLMVVLAASLGLRRSEVASLHTNSLVAYPDGWTLRISGKGDQVRELPLTDELGHLLSQLPDGWVFPSRDPSRHLSPARVGELVSAHMPAKWTAHTLRHRFASRAYAAERDIMAVRDLMGHANVSTTQIYTQVPAGARRAAVQAAAIAT